MSRPVFRVLTPAGAEALLAVSATLLPLLGWAWLSARLFGGAA